MVLVFSIVELSTHHRSKREKRRHTFDSLGNRGGGRGKRGGVGTAFLLKRKKERKVRLVSEREKALVSYRIGGGEGKLGI